MSNNTTSHAISKALGDQLLDYPWFCGVAYERDVEYPILSVLVDPKTSLQEAQAASSKALATVNVTVVFKHFERVNCLAQVDNQPIFNLFAGLEQVRQVDTLNGHLRIETIFEYQDGTSIDLFVMHTNEVKQIYCLTDFAQTIILGADAVCHLDIQPKIDESISKILTDLGIARSGGMFQINFEPTHDSAQLALTKLVKACISVYGLYVDT